MALQIATLPVGQMAANCYIASDATSGEAIIVDPGDDPEYIEDHLVRLSLTPTMIAATHGHIDHIMGARALQMAYGIPFALHASDAFLLKSMVSSARHFLGPGPIDPPPTISRYLKEGDAIPVGAEALTILEVPGHTPGSVVLYSKKGKWAIVGDTVFAGGGMGRTDFSYSEKKKLSSSIGRILALPPGVMLYPGHGEPTGVGQQRQFHSLDML